MAKKKYHYYVQISLRNGTHKYVTSVNNANKTAEWKAGELPFEMEQFWARDLCLGLCLNYTMAVVIESQIELNDDFFRNPTESEE